jgi:hypothetical protein
MQTIEYRTIDKSKWIERGPWDEEPDKKQWLDPATGLPCLIRRAGSLGHLCGYAGVPPGHPLHGKHCDEVDVRVHGGLTFARGCGHGDEATSVCHKPDPGEPDDVWWFGFDCGHCMDLSPGIVIRIPDDDATYCDFAYVTREVERLAEQLARSGR